MRSPTRSGSAWRIAFEHYFWATRAALAADELAS